MPTKISIFWFRRDLRLDDNHGLFHALSSNFPVLPIFIFDTNILSTLEGTHDKRVDYIHQNLEKLNNQLHQFQTTLQTFIGNPVDIFKALSQKYSLAEVYCNADYEPKALQRDTEISAYLKSINCTIKSFKDQVIFDKNEICKDDGNPYTVYSYYAKKWRQKLSENPILFYDANFSNFYQTQALAIHSLEDIGFKKTDVTFQEATLPLNIIRNYHNTRDIPSIHGTSKIGTALRFGTISIRQCVQFAQEYNDTWLSELIWRDFFMQILYHFPHVEKRAFKPKYDHIIWKNDEKQFALWCEGKTGVAIVDAGMRELNATGFMHNRVRMITASFLCKNLLIDWRWGEAYFAQKLLDYDLASNNGNWQWAAGCGCDAAPYFRVFSPILQTKKFDPQLAYIKKWVPEYQEIDYVPMVDLTKSKEVAIAHYKNFLV